jgi:phosphate transport system protein
LAVIKVTTDLERIGDEAVKIGRQAILLSEGGAHDETGIKVRSIAMRVNTMLKAALDSFARLHTEGALSVILTDDDIDEAYLDAREWLVEFVEDQPETLRASMAYLWILKSLERVGDHAANIAEQVIYLTRGLDVRHLGSAKVRDLVS